MTPSSLPVFSISAVERETGLSKDALRAWERRYGFPQPVLDQFGERIYPLDQVEKLRLLKSLLDQGHRPGKVIGLNLEQMRALAGESDRPGGAPVQERDDLLHCIGLCKAHQFDELRRLLSRLSLRMGLFRFIVEVLAPLTAMVGNRWASGELAVYEEHLYTESVQIVMRNAIAGIPRPHSGASVRPRVLLTTFPQEQHGLGLLMAEAVFALEGAYCVSLGVQTPVLEIAQAALAQQADIIALSFSIALNRNQVLEGLADLRSELPPGMEIWAGGRCPVLYRRPPEDIVVLDLPEIHDLLEAWRARHVM